MNETTDSIDRDQPEVRWVGEINAKSSNLGLPDVPNVRRPTLYRAKPETGTYNHHGYITQHDDILLSTWSNHARDEDAPGQRVLWSLSTDEGRTWSPWKELFPPQDKVKCSKEQDDAVDRALIANGFAPADDGLFAIAEEHVMENRRGLGRLARQVNADGSTGPIFWLRENPPASRDGFPDFPDASDPEFAEKAEEINAWLDQPEHLPSWEFHHQTSRRKAADGHQLCEPTQAWQLEDGTYVRLWRDLGDPRSGRNYAQFSYDGGDSWTDPVQADFPDACSRSAAGQLPDGTAYLINNPGNTRDPLIISLADDGLTFDRHGIIVSGAPPRRHDGRAKGPGFQYPRATVGGENLYLIYSVNKEDVEVATIPIQPLKTPSGA